MAGQIKIVVTTNAASAQRDLVGLGKAVGRIGSLQPAGFNKAKFAVSYAGPAFAAYQKLFRKTGDAQRQFQQQAARSSDIPIRTTGLRQAIRDYASLGGEARTTLADMNRRTTQLEETSKQAYSTATTKLEQYKNSANTVVGRIKRIAVATAAIGAASRGISAASGYLKDSVSAASDLNEQTSRTQQVFGKASTSVLAFASTSAKALGQTNSQALTAAGSFGNFFVNLGLSQRAAGKMSTQLLTTAADLASFNNIDPGKALDSLTSALAGEYDPLQSLGFAISATAVANEALSDGLVKRVVDQDKVKAATLRADVAQRKYTATIAKFGAESIKGKSAQASLVSAQNAVKKAAAGTAGKLSQVQQAQATYNLVLKQTGKASGDFQRTQNGLANSQRQVSAGFTDLKAKIGTALLPGVIAVTIAIRDKLLPHLSALVDRYGPKVNAFITALATKGLGASDTLTGLSSSLDSLKTIGTSLGTLTGPALDGLGSALTIVSSVLKTLAANVDLIAKAMPFLVGGFIAYKAAVLGANIASAASFPLKVAELVVNRQLIKSNIALIASREGLTAATIGETAAESVSTVAKIRGAGASVGSRIATLAAAAATRVMAGAQVALNLAMSLNPVALVVIAIAALVAIIVIAYRKSDTFRKIIDKLWSSLKSGLSGSLAFVRKHWVTIAALLGGPLLIAVRLFVKHKTKILSIFRSIKAGIVSIFAGIGGLITSALKATINSAIDLIDRPLRAVNAVSSKVPGVPDLPLIPKLAKGGIVTRPTLLIAGEAGSEAIVPLKGRGFGTTTNNYTITVQAGIGNPVEIGRSVVTSVQAFERARGQLVLSNAS